RRDVLVQALANAVAAVYWFNPLAWLGAFQMRRLREIACDDMVLNVGMNSRDYAEVLVDIARSCRRAQGEPAVAMARGSNVEQRVLAILDTQRSRLSLSRRGARGLAAAVVGLVVVVGSAQVGLQADPP